jgi:acetyl-CoA synthetase
MSRILPYWFREDCWVPPPGSTENRRVNLFMLRQGIPSYRDLLDRSVAEPDWFYGAALADLDLGFPIGYSSLRDSSLGIPWTKWFLGAKTNLVEMAIDRWRKAGHGSRTALVWEGEDGSSATLTFEELGQQVDRAADGLRALGVGRGDVVALYIPMIPEAAIALFAAAGIGAIAAPAFSGYGVDALLERLDLAGAKVLITADGTLRRGKRVDLLQIADEAARASAAVQSVVVVDHLGHGDSNAHLQWSDVIGEGSPNIAAEKELFDPDTPFLLAFTSGSTGRPKGVVQGHGLMPIRLGIELAYCFDLHLGDRFSWVTDMGWIMGPLMLTGPLTLGASAVMMEGAADYPSQNRLWTSIESLGITHLGLSPSLVRSMIRQGEQSVDDYDLASLRAIGLTGEAIDPSSWRWLHRHVGRGYRPIINYSGGTEVGCGLLVGSPIVKTPECRFAGPTPGISLAVYNDEGEQVRGVAGELVVTEPWPSATLGLWNEADRYFESYWSRWPDMWAHGDKVVEFEDGTWQVIGRSDDVIKIGGKRVSPTDYESLATRLPGVEAAAAVGVPDPILGEAVVVLVKLRPDTPGEEVCGQIKGLIERALGKALRARDVLAVGDLPITRSGKIHRRAIRSILTGSDPGDLSTLDNPESIADIRDSAVVGRSPEGLA